MPTIVANNGIITQINVFVVTPDRQDELVRALEEAAEIACQVPGWVSASVHKSFDGTQVTNYAQSTSHESWDLMMEKLLAAGIIQRLNEIATPAPRLYECVYTAEVPNAEAIVRRVAP
jgi:trans-aconitate methyltransferase